MIIGIDFDGTCVQHNFPHIGKDIGAVPVLKKLINKGHSLILHTMRSDKDDNDYLSQAIDWFWKNDITLYGINYNPKQSSWTSSPKPYCNIYIDDSALGCPLTVDGYVDWDEVEKILKTKEIL